MHRRQRDLMPDHDCGAKAPHPVPGLARGGAFTLPGLSLPLPPTPRPRQRCKFFSLTETPEDYTIMLDEEGFKELPPSEFMQVADSTWLVLSVVSNGRAPSGCQATGVTKIARSVIAPLAEHHVSVLMLSTYQTDFILVRERDLPVVIHTLAGEFDIYKEESGECVPVTCDDVSNGFLKPKPAASPTLHPVQSPQTRFCVLTVAPDTLPAIATMLIDVLFYSHSPPREAGAGSQDLDSITFFAFSLIEGYISIVMDAETQKRFPSDLLLTSSTGELWRMVRIGGQPLAVTKGLFILWAVPGQGGRPLQPPTLQQIQALVRHMAEDAQELFAFYVSPLPQGGGPAPVNNLCRNNRPPEWLRGPVMVPGGVRGTMARMAQALQDITRHHRDLNPPGAEILRRLASTHLKVFRQKLEGCRILWSYARFMAKLSAQLEARSRRARREKRRSRRGSRLSARS
ncbi:PREDICTED: GATS-like protein 3 [Aptenodytes forsteri]|nr:PREDICTED: GATS-like protein 3 [Aptenodytes forsteri]